MNADPCRYGYRSVIHNTAMNNRIRMCIGIKMLQYRPDLDATIKDVSALIPGPKCYVHFGVPDPA
jgi:hypothetical protein